MPGEELRRNYKAWNLFSLFGSSPSILLVVGDVLSVVRAWACPREPVVGGVEPRQPGGRGVRDQTGGSGSLTWVPRYTVNTVVQGTWRGRQIGTSAPRWDLQGPLLGELALPPPPSQVDSQWTDRELGWSRPPCPPAAPQLLQPATRRRHGKLNCIVFFSNPPVFFFSFSSSVECSGISPVSDAGAPAASTVSTRIFLSQPAARRSPMDVEFLSSTAVGRQRNQKHREKQNKMPWIPSPTTTEVA